MPLNMKQVKDIILKFPHNRDYYWDISPKGNAEAVRVALRTQDLNTVWMMTSDEEDFETKLACELERITVKTQVVDDTANTNTQEEQQMTTTKLGADYAKETLKGLNTRILKIAKAENIVHVELAAFSREVLDYVLRTKDVTPVNRIIGIDKDKKAYLTRNNRVVAMHFFSEFLPFTTEGKASDATLTFGKIKGERSLEKCTKAINDFLHNPEANIWTWAKENVTTEKKPVDYAAKVGNAITAALDADKGNMTKSDVLMAVLRNGISIEDMLDVAKMFAEQEHAA